MPRLKADKLAAPNGEDEIRGYLNGDKYTRYKGAKKYTPLHGQRGKDTAMYGQQLAGLMKLRYVQGHTYPDMEEITGLSQHEIKKRLHPFKVIMEDPDRIKAFKLNEPHILDAIRMLALDGMYSLLSDPKSVKGMKPHQLALAYGIMFDKARLERGESTQNVMSLSDMIRAAHSKEVPLADAEIVPHEAALIENPKSVDRMAVEGDPMAN